MQTSEQQEQVSKAIQELTEESRGYVREHFLAYCEKKGASLSGVELAYQTAGNWIADVAACWVPRYFQSRHGLTVACGPPKSGLVIYGEVGRGKTYLARKIFEFLQGIVEKYDGQRNPVFYYDTEFYLGAHIKGNQFLDEFFFGNAHTILFFDDLGNEADTKNYGTVFSGREIIRYRHICQERHSVPTVLTTNLTKRNLAERYGVYAESRVSGDYEGIYLDYATDRRQR